MIHAPREESSLSDLTIIIFSKDRNKFLKSTIHFYSQFQVQTIVLHHCDTPIPDAEIPNNCRYLPGSLGIAERLIQAANNIKTSYTVMISDDEYLIPSALIKIIKRMKDDDNLSSCFGQTVALNKYKKRMLGNLAYPSLRTYSNTNDSILERVQYHLHQNNGTNPIGSVYRVMKYEIFKKLVMFWSENLDTNSCKYTFEIAADIYLTVLGKSEYIDEVVWCRNWVNPSINDTSVNRDLYYYEWWENIAYMEEKNNYINRIFKDMSKFMTMNELNKILQDFYNSRKQIELNEENQKSIKSWKFTKRKLKAKVHLIMNYWLAYNTNDIKEILRNVNNSKISYDESQFENALLEFKKVNF